MIIIKEGNGISLRCAIALQGTHSTQSVWRIRKAEAFDGFLGPSFTIRSTAVRVFAVFVRAWLALLWASRPLRMALVRDVGFGIAINADIFFSRLLKSCDWSCVLPCACRNFGCRLMLTIVTVLNACQHNLKPWLLEMLLADATANQTLQDHLQEYSLCYRRQYEGFEKTLTTCFLLMLSHSLYRQDQLNVSDRRWPSDASWRRRTPFGHFADFVVSHIRDSKLWWYQSWYLWISWRIWWWERHVAAMLCADLLVPWHHSYPRSGLVDGQKRDPCQVAMASPGNRKACTIL